MVMVVVDDSCLKTVGLVAQVRLLGLRPLYIHHMNWVNSRNDLGHDDWWQHYKFVVVIIILHSLICRVLLLLLLLLRNTSDLRNCTSYFGACMWVWYCRPPIGAHFHPTPQPPPQLGEKAHLRTVAAVLATTTPAWAGAGLRRQAVVGLHTRGLAVEQRLVQATAVRRSHSSCYY